jgi:hypothetical protein
MLPNETPEECGYRDPFTLRQFVRLLKLFFGARDTDASEALDHREPNVAGKRAAVQINF